MTAGRYEWCKESRQNCLPAPLILDGSQPESAPHAPVSAVVRVEYIDV